MKEVIALCVALSISTITIYMAATNQIELKLTVTFLGFALASGLAIANYDVVRKLKMGDLEFETISAEIERTKDKALRDITQQVDAQREATELLVRELNDTSADLEEQGNRLRKAIERANTHEKTLELQMLIMEAQSGNRTSFDNLRELATTLGGDHAVLANRSIETIEDTFDPVGRIHLYRSQVLTVTDSAGKPVSLEKVPWQRLVKDYADLSAENRKKVLDTLAEKADPDAVPFIIDQLRHEEDLKVCAAAMKCLRTLTGEKSGPLDFEYWAVYSADGKQTTPQ